MRVDLTLHADLAPAQEAALTRIDDAAGAARARYITVAPGQDAVYQLKAEEAQRYQDAGGPMPIDPGTYPFVATEAAATGKTPAQVAGSILGTRDFWIVKAALIEAARISGKNAVSAATTVRDCIVARNSAIEQLNAL